jgi:hypothetical protein
MQMPPVLPLRMHALLTHVLILLNENFLYGDFHYCDDDADDLLFDSLYIY